MASTWILSMRAGSFQIQWLKITCTWRRIPSSASNKDIPASAPAK
jgi:hypothetical protein